MKKYFITSDTHSFYNELIEELKIKWFGMEIYKMANDMFIYLFYN